MSSPTKRKSRASRIQLQFDPPGRWRRALQLGAIYFCTFSIAANAAADCCCSVCLIVYALTATVIPILKKMKVRNPIENRMNDPTALSCMLTLYHLHSHYRVRIAKYFHTMIMREMMTNNSEEKNATVPLTIGNIQSALYSGAMRIRNIESGIQT